MLSRDLVIPTLFSQICIKMVGEKESESVLL